MKTTEARPQTTDVTVSTTGDEPRTGAAAPQTTAVKPDAAKDAPDAMGRLPWEQWGARKRVSAADLRTARILRNWADGRVLTESDFDAAVEEGRNLVFR